LCVQFKVVVFTGVNILSRKCLAVVHLTAGAGLKTFYGSLAFLQTAKGPKMAEVISLHDLVFNSMDRGVK